MPLAQCPKCGATFPNTLRECPRCGYSPFARPAVPPQGGAPNPSQNVPPLSPTLQPVITQENPVEPDPPESSGSSEVSEGSPLMRRLLPIAAVALGLALIAGGIFWMQSRKKNPAPAPDPAPVYCAEGDHVWAEATCTEPKTCTICGKTEGEALGHEFTDNVCARCGAYEQMFTFSDLACERNRSIVTFTGSVKNYSGTDATKLRIKLELFDANENVLIIHRYDILEQEVIPPLGSAQWEIQYDDSGLIWKYWRVTIVDYSANDAQE